MSRGFFGGGGKKGGSRSGKKSGTNVFSRRGATRKEMIQDKSSHSVKDYSEMLEDLLDEKLMSEDPRKYNFHMPGTQAPEKREMTKGQKAAMELIKQKRMKKRTKKREQKVEVIPKAFGDGPTGGRIDKKGNIMDNKGRILFRINLSTGVITNNTGMKVGKYKPNSLVCDTKIQKMIERQSKASDVFNPFAPKE
ncbi:MAG: hypothetical protein COV36_06330 [Alphaproteobacteria bacterium CG11_big_fil_rev_8_21_14_0_20_44_7]|nr:MAG: hypothetical protein COV36_06330 [Alphaproteobacteria bacterium CG11_big_fil_rev_8_21_14_0_20_44_7]